MNTENIIAQIDTEILRLQQVKNILAGISVKKSVGRPSGSGQSVAAKSARPARREMSAEGKAKIAAAQKARWAKVKKTAKKSVVA
jgi:hypothetical protein